MIKRIRNKRINTGPVLNGPVLNGPGRELGQSLVEMAVMMVVLLLIMGGVLDLGRMYFTYLALQNAAGEGAAYGAINPQWVDSSDNADPNNITYRVQSESTGNLIDWSTTTVAVNVPNIAGGEPITVTVNTVTLHGQDTQLIFLDEE